MPVRIRLQSDPSLCVATSYNTSTGHIDADVDAARGVGGLRLMRCAGLHIRAQWATDEHKVQYQLHHERELFRFLDDRDEGHHSGKGATTAIDTAGRRIKAVATPHDSACLVVIPADRAIPGDSGLAVGVARHSCLPTGVHGKVGLKAARFGFEFDPMAAVANPGTTRFIAMLSADTPTNETLCLAASHDGHGAALGISPCATGGKTPLQHFLVSYATEPPVRAFPEPSPFQPDHRLCPNALCP